MRKKWIQLEKEQGTYPEREPKTEEEPTISFRFSYACGVGRQAHLRRDDQSFVFLLKVQPNTPRHVMWYPDTRSKTKLPHCVYLCVYIHTDLVATLMLDTLIERVERVVPECA